MDRRVRKTRETITEAFMELLKEKDFERITINEIAERADVNRGTVYLHYEDKFDLLTRCIETYLQELDDSCRPYDLSAPPEESLLRTFEYLERNAEIFSVLIRQESIPVFRARLAAMLKQGIERQFDCLERRDLLNREIAVQFLTTAVVGLLEWWIVRSMPYPASEMVKQLLLLLEGHGIDRNALNAQISSSPL
ncbi:TetR/AcrR family transcriptional regulator [Saccharibacillus sp. CPCC 101409]|uniref:TetR/AcrR family transcriptional regulator n=1 Tax=Saccharibacillus sp. CPCC 101409 TaxID=3058041 RepID=UPI0026714BAF|nr:TetR/AcrR family transcriptional regulator [Saccharibacillus sp. CPCC 101409]MDO3412169.1 TetR/AcrR family transcriptional regulator [Saccharibacillus sp. CPCC 101409]